jgi:hypothetical protein
MTGLCLRGIVGAGSLAYMARSVVDYITAGVGTSWATNLPMFRFWEAAGSFGRKVFSRGLSPSGDFGSAKVSRFLGSV